MSINDIEKEIYNIWSKVIACDNLDMNCNFFDAGGTSLMLIRVVIEIKARLGVDIEVVDLFRYRTIESLSQFISEQE